jgi:amino acid adenylation domain-containing protein
VLKAGGAYVPLDPAYPKGRLAFMIADAELSLVLTQAHLAANISDCAARLIRLDDDWESIAQEPAGNLSLTAKPEHLAYVIYTSGSTGNPKGVMIEHRSLVNFSETAADAYSIKRGDRVLQFASICFDLSIEEIFPALTNGATVVLRTADMISSAHNFLRCCNEWNLTVLDLPTAYWHDLTLALSEEKLSLPARVRLVIIGGEKASLDRVNLWHQLTNDSVRLVNTYGPTEATVVATMCDLPKPLESRSLNLVSIGRPLRNTTAFVLDKFQQPVPIGVAGELYIGGPGVARGYINRAELTAEKFIRDPFSPEPEGKLYRTGDLVRYLADGNIEFLGRVDNQIKIRGFRVELEEIEEALRGHAAVNECVVVLHEDTDGDKSLLAYVVPHGNIRPTSNELRKFLKAKLPSYMVPTMFESLDAFPLMPNGKLDRRALPEPQPARPDLDESFVAPSTPLEGLLADAWKNVLKLTQVGVHDNFFELGGHSLLAARVVANLRRTLDVELNMVDIFRTPTISGLAAMLSAPAAAGETESELAALFEEMAGLTDEEAQLCFEREMEKGAGVAA